ncbi:uncharacterized protein LOC143195510 isoform X2 [Rhynchophorus ferrugineus]|uniref:uncharacterized protein LOC143195510 isoform X2 n=1 Tax=Rhynchophorus ferrugineus TaxID=354439 RepID=UPI003FCCA7AF
METKNIQNEEREFILARCNSHEVIEINDSPPLLENDGIPQIFNKNDNNIEIINVQDEPMDLTYTKSVLLNYGLQATRFSENSINNKDLQKGNKRKLEYSNFNDQEPSTSSWSLNPQYHRQIYSNPRKFQEIYSCIGPNVDPLRVFSQLGSRQQEILKMAKSIFSKRTRTLYHWIYPTASKQQVKQVVSNTWDSMSPQEKGIYVAQVLAKFGYTSGDLMINPQLGQIKQLPFSPAALKFNAKATELQNAISSISKKSDNSENSPEKYCGRTQILQDWLPTARPSVTHSQSRNQENCKGA